MKNNKILFIYTFESKTGLSGKAAKIEQGFLDAGCTLDAIYLGSGGDSFTRIAEMLSVYARSAMKIIFGRYDIVFMRYAYYFMPLYFIAFCMRKNLQVELNSNVSAELIARDQKIRARLDMMTMSLVRRAAKRIHVVSKSLTSELKLKYPKANYVFTANFVVDEHYAQRQKYKSEKIKLVFLGNCAQKWHGIPLFIDVILAADAGWFRSACELHFIGSVDDDTQEAIARNNLDGCVCIHGLLFGEAKHAVLREMDLGLSSFDLMFKGMQETTAIKTGEYLYNGIGLVIGYVDPVIPASLPFVLSLDLQGNPNSEREKFRGFIAEYKNIPNVAESAHQYAEQNLLVNGYINHIISSDW